MDETVTRLLTKQEKEQYTKEFGWVVYAQAKKYGKSYDGKIDKEDLEGVGWVGFAKALNAYLVNNDRNAKFSSLAFKYVTSEIIAFARKEYRRNSNEQTLATVDEPSDDYSERTNLTNLIADDALALVDQIAEKDIVSLIYKIAEEELNAKEKFVFDNRFSLEGEKKVTQLEIATLFNMTQAGVCKFEKCVAEKIRTKLIFHYGIDKEAIRHETFY